MKRIYKVYKKTVSIVNETSTGMYRNLVGEKKGFLLESYDKNYDRYTFFGKEPEEIITSRGDALVIRRNNGTEEIRQGKSRPLKNITSGEHFHTVSADSAQTLDLIEEELRKKDYLVRTVK